MAEEKDCLDFIEGKDEEVKAEYQKFIDELIAGFPKEVSVNLPQDDIPSENKIAKANIKAEEALFDARLKITNLYIECEQKRLEQQKPLLDAVIGLTKIQLICFNVVICVLTYVIATVSFFKMDLELWKVMLDFLKYYIGAVVVELLGMLFFIAKSTFSSNYNKIMENILDPNPKKDKK